MMAGLPEKTFLERWATPSVIFALASAIMGQLLFTVWWARGESSRITAVEVMTSNLRQDIFTFNTPLSARVLKLEGREQDHADLRARIDAIDGQGTRALTVVSSNQQRVMNQIDRLADRLIMMDKRVNETEGRTAQTTAIVTEKMTMVDKRLESLEKRLSELVALIAHPSYKTQSEESRPYELPR